jgi:hypothetical protein
MGVFKPDDRREEQTGRPDDAGIVFYCDASLPSIRSVQQQDRMVTSQEGGQFSVFSVNIGLVAGRYEAMVDGFSELQTSVA